MTTEPRNPDPHELLNRLRRLRDELFDAKTVKGVKKLSAEERGEFVARRMELSETILHIETAQLAEIRRALERTGAELDRGMTELAESLADLEAAARWAEGIGKLLSVVTRIVPVL